MRGKFDPRRIDARPQLPTLRGRKVAAAALLASSEQRAPGSAPCLPHQLDETLIVDFDTLGPKGVLAEPYARLVADLHAQGVRVHGTFTLGYDHDELDAFERLVAWVERVGLERVVLRLWTPVLGTEQTHALARAGRLRHLDHSRWDGAHVVVEPLAMSPETLQRGWAWAQTRLDSMRSRWLRRRQRERAAGLASIGVIGRFTAALAQLASARRPDLVRARGGV